MTWAVVYASPPSPEVGAMAAGHLSHSAKLLGWEGWVTIIMTAGAFALLVMEMFPPYLVMLSCSAVLTIIGIIDSRDFLSGFSQDVVFTIGMLSIVARSLEVNGILRYVAQKGLSKCSNGVRDLIRILVPTLVVSGFLNNTPIVLILTPVIRQWAADNDLKPSKYLIPLSYATILGGTCTLIGTSGNLVVHGLMRRIDPSAGFSFFELAWVGVPCCVVGLIYLLFFAQRLLPERDDPVSKLKKETPDVMGEFLVKDDCELVNMTVLDAASEAFHGALLVEIERGGHLIDSPGPYMRILVGDRLIFFGEVDQIAALHLITGLQTTADPHFQIDSPSLHISEIVVSAASSFIGKTLKRINFRLSYGASVIAIYRQGRRLTGRVGDQVIQAGDVLMLISSEPWRGADGYHANYYCVRFNRRVQPIKPTRVWLILPIMLAMVGIAIMTGKILVAGLFAAFVMLVTRCVTSKEAQQAVAWNLLVLIASCFAVGAALMKTGVAELLASLVLSIVGTNPYALIAGIFLLTAVFTECMTNSVAALLLFSIAYGAVTLAGYESLSAMKAVGVTVAIASSCSFVTPIGYQTNTIVYGPGGYYFGDYFKVGLPLTIAIMLITIFSVPQLWPLS